jgi:mRNA-degrading endonuclease RelE of RelBE toxin-antitoxin system
MELKFETKPTKFFLSQLKKLTLKEKRIISDKLKIIRENPFRYKKLKGYRNTFEVKLNFEDSYSRLIYCVFVPETNNITVFGIFKRRNDFKDFKNFYKNFSFKN